jgi:hypothetical protein
VPSRASEVTCVLRHEVCQVRNSLGLARGSEGSYCNKNSGPVDKLPMQTVEIDTQVFRKYLNQDTINKALVLLIVVQSFLF